MKAFKLKLDKIFFLRLLVFIPSMILLVAVIFLGRIIFEQQINTEISSSLFSAELGKAKQETFIIKNEDQYKKNQRLQTEITAINKTYKDSISSYEKLIDLRTQKQDTSAIDSLYAQIVKFLADKNYASASASLTDLNNQIQQIKAKIVTTFAATKPMTNAPVSNIPPGSGYSLQSVSVEGTNYNVSIIAADLNSTKVIIDTASESDCSNNCPVKSLSEYVSANGAFAGINGSFFCPAEYPSCAGKTGSFDTLLMNKSKHYFNSDNNIYSTIPAAIFSSGSARFVSQSLQWGRDTGVDGVIANYPLLVSGGNINFTENPNEPKFGAKGARTFIAAKGSTVHIGVIYNATMGESAKVLHALGMNDAMNLDEGGSTALWYQGKYLVGPGRNIPNAVLFVKK